MTAAIRRSDRALLTEGLQMREVGSDAAAPARAKAWLDSGLAIKLGATLRRGCEANGDAFVTPVSVSSEG